MRAKAEIEEKKNGKYAIIVTEIPYQVNKADLVSKIAELVRDKKILGITDLRDESNREGIRVVIELKKESYPKKILNQLYKLTAMQQSFNFNMIALTEDLQPKLLDLKQILSYFITHREIVVTNRVKFELRIAKEREHILEGLKIALDYIDQIISTIRASETKEVAHKALMENFKLTDIQAKAILEMRLQTLAGLERKKIEDELAEKLALISNLEAILADPQKIIAIIKDEIKEIRDKYQDNRRTEVHTEGVGKIENKDTIPNEPMLVILSKENYIKRLSPSTFRTQNRGGKGVVGTAIKEEDEVAIIKEAMTHDNVLFFTNFGRVFRLPVYEIPVSSRTAKGQAIVNILQLQDGENVTTMLTSGDEKSGQYLVMATNKGTIKKTAITDFTNVRKSGLIAIKLRDGDHLKWSKLVTEGSQIMIVTKEGKSIRFFEKDVTPTGRTSMGVRGIKLKDKDEVVDMDIVKNPELTELLVIMENGLGKCTKVSDFREQTRGGTGVKCANVTEKTGKIVGAKIIDDQVNGDLLMISRQGQTIRMPIKDIPSQGRATQGVYLMRLSNDDAVASASVIDAQPENFAETETANEAPDSQETLIETN